MADCRQCRSPAGQVSLSPIASNNNNNQQGESRCRKRQTLNTPTTFTPTGREPLVSGSGGLCQWPRCCVSSDTCSRRVGGKTLGDRFQINHEIVAAALSARRAYLARRKSNENKGSIRTCHSSQDNDREARPEVSCKRPNSSEPSGWQVACISGDLSKTRAQLAAACPPECRCRCRGAFKAAHLQLPLCGEASALSSSCSIYCSSSSSSVSSAPSSSASGSSSVSLSFCGASSARELTCPAARHLQIGDDDDDDEKRIELSSLCSDEEPSLSASFPPPIEQAIPRRPKSAIGAPLGESQKQQQIINNNNGHSQPLKSEPAKQINNALEAQKLSFQPERAAYLNTAGGQRGDSLDGANGHPLGLREASFGACLKPIGEIRCKSDEPPDDEGERDTEESRHLASETQTTTTTTTTMLDFRRKFRAIGQLVSFIQTSRGRIRIEKAGERQQHASSHSTSASNASPSASRSSSAASSGARQQQQRRPDGISAVGRSSEPNCGELGVEEATGNKVVRVAFGRVALAQSGAVALAKHLNIGAPEQEASEKGLIKTCKQVQVSSGAKDKDKGAAENPKLYRIQQLQQQKHHLPNANKRRQNNMDIRREKKAAKTLAIITGVFVCCWLPFFLNAIIMPACGPTCTPNDLILSVLLWLGYLNSLLNPIIYTIFSPDFRRAFRRLLCWPKRQRRSVASAAYLRAQRLATAA